MSLSLVVRIEKGQTFYVLGVVGYNVVVAVEEMDVSEASKQRSQKNSSVFSFLMYFNCYDIP